MPTFDRPEVREDMVFLRSMRAEFNVLIDISEQEVRRVAGNEGSVVIACADGDQFFDLIQHHRIICGCERGCHHSIALNGGPLLCSDHVSAHLQHDGEVILRHAFQGKELKGLDTLVLYGHAPCGMAGANRISAAETLSHYVRAKDRFRRYAEEHQIRLTACLLWMHIQWPDGRRNSYFFNRKAWENPDVVSFRNGWLSSSAIRAQAVERCWRKFWPARAA